MPRSKPDGKGVSVIRLELGGWERERIKQAELVAAGTLLLPAVGVAAFGLAAAGASYALYQWLKDGVFTPLTDAGEELRIKVKNAEAEYRAKTPDVVESGIDSIIDHSPLLRYNRWWYRLIF